MMPYEILSLLFQMPNIKHVKENGSRLNAEHSTCK